ncbi:MAG: aminopeptidase N [Dehalococcoidia bacterium]|nr:aminopeptidase N [Dehalococcoidia bacterium]
MDAPTPTTRDVLTQDEAAQRARHVSQPEYRLDLDLHAGAERYRGDLTVTFQAQAGGETFLDFTGARLERLEVNGQAVASPRWNAYRLYLDGIRAGENTVRVVYENEYNHGGDGFHQFVDPEDGEEYLYSNFEPFNAHWLFPCFDQPDIKGRYTLTVTAPEAWRLIANGRPETVEPVEGGRKRVRFVPTRTFSTYLFALVAGPYEVFRGQWRDVPLAFYARKSLAPFVDQEELFQVTEQGLEFFSRFFDYDYPFEKYDQIFVPEFNAGAMENVAAVTHTEHIVFRDPPTENDRLERAEIILHEMAHMWFGNLVTMQWWNDLWLNESFATYMSYLALTEATRFTSAWQDFNSGMKSWAYTEDERVTTHPISGVVRDTDETFLNFDGITYGKGAAVIKQLVAAVGLEGFRNGMRGYFRKHEYGNTTLSDWLDSLGEGAERDLQPWAQAWLETASLNTIAATVETDGARITDLTLEQTAPAQYPTLRPHTLEVAMLRRDGGRIEVEEVGAHIEGASASVPEAVGKPAPHFVFLNHRDHGFVKVALDAASVDFVRDHLEEVEDPLLRLLIWQTLWTMVRDQQLKSTDFLDLALPRVVAETDIALVESILGRLSAAVSRYVPEEQKAQAAHRVFAAAWEAAERVEDPNLKIIWARTLFATAINPEDLAAACDLADGVREVAGLTVDQDMRWSAAASAVAQGLEGAWERVERERERDKSDRGQRAVIRCQVSRPDPDVKQEAWEKFTGNEGYGSLHLTAAAMGGFHWWRQADLLEPYVERYFERLPEVFEHRDNEFAQRFFNNLWPGYRVDRSLPERSQHLLAEHGERLPTLRRQLLEANDDLERAIRCREFAAS